MCMCVDASGMDCIASVEFGSFGTLRLHGEGKRFVPILRQPYLRRYLAAYINACEMYDRQPAW